jgi:hypothetical protein
MRDPRDEATLAPGGGAAQDCRTHPGYCIRQGLTPGLLRGTGSALFNPASIRP